MGSSAEREDAAPPADIQQELVPQGLREGVREKPARVSFREAFADCVAGGVERFVGNFLGGNQQQSRRARAALWQAFDRSQLNGVDVYFTKYIHTLDAQCGKTTKKTASPFR